MSATCCPRGPGATRPHTWKQRGKMYDRCRRCNATRAEANGRPEPQVQAGAWASVRTVAGLWRGYVERIDGGVALMRGAHLEVRGAVWPFPWERRFQLARLTPAPAPRFEELKE